MCAKDPPPCCSWWCSSLVWAAARPWPMPPLPRPLAVRWSPLTLEELEEVEGAWAAQTVVGAAVGGVCYLITTPVSQWNLGDCLRHVVAGAVSGFFGSFF